MVDNNYYNPYWGYQNGEKRNSRVRSGNKLSLHLMLPVMPSGIGAITTMAA